MKEITYIYFLHKGDNIPFYIGKSVFPKGRMSLHRKSFGNIFMEVIDSVPTHEWLFWEKWYISLFKGWGFILNNKNIGGGGVSYHSNETKLKMKKLKPEGFGEKITNRLKGKPQSPKTISKRVEKITGKKRTLEQREKLSKAFKGRVFTEERNKKIGDTQRGTPKPKSLELIAKLKKPILQYDKKGNFLKEWTSAKDAGEFYGSDTTIQNALKQRRCKTAYGFIWKYKE
jgi:hypothetical protein